MNDNDKKRPEDLPHYEPAHVTQGKTLDDMLNGVPGMPPSMPQKRPGNNNNNNNNNGGWKEIDANNIMSNLLARKAMANNTHHQQQSHHHHQSSPPAANMVYLREGQEGFKQLQISESTVPIAIKTGPIAGVSGREFEFKGIRNFYIIENQREAVNLSNIDHSRMKRLAVVSAPLLGTFLVPESAVIKNRREGPQVLND